MFYDDSIRVILHHLFYEYHYSPHKLAFQTITRVGDQKLMIDLEWPNIGKSQDHCRTSFEWKREWPLGDDLIMNQDHTTGVRIKYNYTPWVLIRAPLF